MTSYSPTQRRHAILVRLNSEEREALNSLSQRDHLPVAVLVRMLIWRSAEQRGERIKGEALNRRRVANSKRRHQEENTDSERNPSSS